MSTVNSLKDTFNKTWNLRWKYLCASTESSLTEWLSEQPLLNDERRAFFASCQTKGMGQQGRLWHSPPGGVWVSAAFPFLTNRSGAGVLGLAAAVALVERLELNGIRAQIKWPNDLMVDDKKLAGLLPRIVRRGDQIRFARIGLGLNISNTVPPEGIQLSQILKHEKNVDVDFWSEEVLRVFDRAIEIVGQPEWVCRLAEQYLWADEVLDVETNELWQILGLQIDGSLKLGKGSLVKSCTRWN